jgi:dTDP-D-glucose 4,6-dehydratase
VDAKDDRDSVSGETVTRIFISGYGGFIGSHLAEYVQQNTDWEICNTNPDYIVHLAGCSQIDESIAHPVETVTRDIGTTLQLLEWARANDNLKKFLYFSSDEVFGPKEYAMEFFPKDRYNSHSPYAAVKAACEELCLAWASTYGVPTVITHCQNLIGERQAANKFLPAIVRAALQGQKVPIYADGLTAPERNFLHVKDACSAIVLLLEKGNVRDKYNIASHFQIATDALVREVARILQVTIDIELRHSRDVRKGFYVGHGLNGSKLAALGWERRPLIESLTETVLWMAKEENRHWIGL